jgi:hypothetical protein
VNFESKYVENLLEQEAKVLEDLGLKAFHDGYDPASKFLYDLAKGLKGRAQLIRMVELNFQEVRSQTSTTNEILERKRQMYMGEY